MLTLLELVALVALLMVIRWLWRENKAYKERQKVREWLRKSLEVGAGIDRSDSE